MWLGVDYYPEQWDPALMEADMDTIREMGGNVIRIAEFSWHLMEKVERQYDFSFFDGVIAMAKEKGLKVIMGTPTAAIPAWRKSTPVFSLNLRTDRSGRSADVTSTALTARRCMSILRKSFAPLWAITEVKSRLWPGRLTTRSATKGAICAGVPNAKRRFRVS